MFYVLTAASFEVFSFSHLNHAAINAKKKENLLCFLSIRCLKCGSEDFKLSMGFSVNFHIRHWYRKTVINFDHEIKLQKICNPFLQTLCSWWIKFNVNLTVISLEFWDNYYRWWLLMATLATVAHLTNLLLKFCFTPLAILSHFSEVCKFQNRKSQNLINLLNFFCGRMYVF